MSSLSSIHEGTISARPFHDEQRGRIGGSHDHPHHRSGESGRSGTLHGCDRSGTLRGSSGLTADRFRGDSRESPESSATAEVNALISSLGSLSNQAQSLP